jgi:hypothetical protein
MNVRSVILIQTAFLLCATLQSLSQIQGLVTDSEGAKISRTTIRVLDGKSRKTVRTTQTDGAGRFDLRDLSPGRYAIAFSSSGFSPELIEVDTTQSGADAFRTIRLNGRDCDAPNENCDAIPLEEQAPDPHPIITQGAITVGTSEGVNLDKRTSVSPTSRTADFRLAEQEGGLYLTPLNKATRLNVCGTEFNHKRAKEETSPLRLDGLGEDTEICMKTTRGRFSKIYLTRDVQPGDQQIMIYVVTRE